ncbi:hypothetical protein GC207_15145 [bacterium]|nr:hypothetical protein [bacterium]
MSRYELWEVDDGHVMFGVPNSQRGDTLHEPGAKLLLRIVADSVDQATMIKEHFLSGDDAGELEALNIPASDFFFEHYQCGIVAGEIVQLQMDYHLALQGHYGGFIERDSVFRVLAGDIEYPQAIWLRITERPSGKPVGGTLSVNDDENFSYTFVAPPI